jgi:hypothetical protein
VQVQVQVQVHVLAHVSADSRLVVRASTSRHDGRHGLRPTEGVGVVQHAPNRRRGGGAQTEGRGRGRQAWGYIGTTRCICAPTAIESSRACQANVHTDQQRARPGCAQLGREPVGRVADSESRGVVESVC